jgi:hypothetical protein
MSGGNWYVEVAADKVSIKANAGGITVSGTATNQNVIITSGEF